MDNIKLPIRVHISEEYDVYCGRPSIWGNPFSHKDSKIASYKTNNKEESLKKHKEWLETNEYLLSKLIELSGKRLACFCKSNQKCHVDNLIEKFKEKFMSVF
jgi:hypothetical protein